MIRCLRKAVVRDSRTHGLSGGRVDYESDTSWHCAMLMRPGELEKLVMDENNPVFRMVNGGIAYLREKYSDYFRLMVRAKCVRRALEMAKQLRGNDFSTISMKSRRTPEGASITARTRFVWNYENRWRRQGDAYGGVVTGFGEWLPGRGPGHVSRIRPQ